MLQLRTYKYNNTYSNQYYYGRTPERLGFGDSGNIRLQNHTYYFRSPSSIIHADLPLHMNRIPFNRYYFCYDEDAEGREQDIIEGIKDGLLNLFNNTTDAECKLVTCYLAGSTLENKDYVYEFIDADLWKEFKGDNIIALFNKCVEQTSLRESERQSRTIKQHIRVFKSKAKHIILMLTDYADIDQESETFLALGLVPVIFENFKSRFTTEEMEYFKCLVNRSQVKRISNVRPTNLFKALEDLEKYHDLEREIRYQTMFTKVAEARVRTVERQSRDLRTQAENALQTYDAALKKLSDYEVLIEKYREGSDEIVSELKDISKMSGVYDLIIDGYNNNILKIVLRVPLDYFDSDEAECAIRNVRDEDVKRFITEVFIEQKFKLIARVDAYYTYSPEANFQDFNQLSEEECRKINALFNPHYQFYHCLGDYKPRLIKAMRNQDLIMFVNIALAAARSINFGDGAVCNRFFEYLSNAFRNDYYGNIKCLEKDGKIYTLYQWLHNEFDTEPEPINVIEAEDL